MQILIPIALVAIFYFIYFARGGRWGAVNRHFGLDAGERAVGYWSAEFATDITLAQRAGTAALGLLAGAVVGRIGITTLRPRGITFVVTDRDRLVLHIENEDRSTTLTAFCPGDGLGITVLGDGNKRLQGGATKLIRLSKRDVPPIDMLVHYTAEQPLVAWAAKSSTSRAA